MELELNGKVALVTGGSRGLGEAICLELAAEGVRIALNFSRSEDEAARLVRTITERHEVKALAVRADVTCEEDVVRLFRQVEAEFSRIDILVNNAGICPTCLIQDMSLELWNRTVSTNLTGTFLASREMVRHLQAGKRPGRIINIVSPAAFKGSVNGKSHYAASKAGVVALTVSLAREVASGGILVNAVAPGMMLTGMTAESLRETEDQERYARSVPLGRLATAEEMAATIAFLASERNSYMTGATVDISGGALLR